MTAKLSLSMQSSIDELSRVAGEVEEFARAQQWPAALEYQIKLAIEEIAINVVNHGHDGERRAEAGIEIESAPDSVVVEISDNGRPFDPLTEAPEPDLDLAIEDRPIGGLGVHLVRTMMDETRYRREDGRNHLTLVKRRNG